MHYIIHINPGSSEKILLISITFSFVTIKHEDLYRDFHHILNVNDASMCDWK